MVYAQWRFAATHSEELVGSLLVLLGHRAGCRLGEHAHRSENSERGTDTHEGVENDLAALIGSRLGTRAVGTEGDPVGCRNVMVSLSLLQEMWGRSVSCPPVSIGVFQSGIANWAPSTRQSDMCYCPWL